MVAIRRIWHQVFLFKICDAVLLTPPLMEMVVALWVVKRRPFPLKAIQQMELKPNTGKSDKYVEWYESTVWRFGSAAAELLLHDISLCDENLEILNAAKCVVANSLEDGLAAYLNNTRYKSEKNLAKFMAVLDKIFIQHIDEEN